MAKVPYGLEILPKISIAWVGCTNVTDRRQTDGRPMTYSEHELEFTFAKNVETNWQWSSHVNLTTEFKEWHTWPKWLFTLNHAEKYLARFVDLHFFSRRPAYSLTLSWSLVKSPDTLRAGQYCALSRISIKGLHRNRKWRPVSTECDKASRGLAQRGGYAS